MGQVEVRVTVMAAKKLSEKRAHHREKQTQDETHQVELGEVHVSGICGKPRHSPSRKQDESDFDATLEDEIRRPAEGHVAEFIAQGVEAHFQNLAALDANSHR